MKGKKKYIIVTPYFPSESSHVGSYIYDQAKIIDSSENFAVKVVKVVSFFSKESDYHFKGIEVSIFKVLDFPFFILPGSFNSLNSIRIRRFFKNKGFIENLDVVHGHISYPCAYLVNAISSMLDVRTIVQHHSLDPLQLMNCRFNAIKKFQYHFIKNRSLRQINKVGLNVSVSNKVSSVLYDYKDYQPRNEYVLYNGVDRTKFYNMDFSRDSTNYILGCVANFWPIKDHINLIKAIELLVREGIDDIYLRLIGTGETLYFCQKFVEKNNLEEHIFFELERSHTQMNIFYNEIDLFVLPSYFEAYGCVLMEAWATETPTISIRGQGFSELIPNDARDYLLADARSPASLKEKIFEQYQNRRSHPFDDKYDINNTIFDFLKQPFFHEK